VAAREEQGRAIVCSCGKYVISDRQSQRLANLTTRDDDMI
jgi:hypothetical protein